jgi:hypothetical protein
MESDAESVWRSGEIRKFDPIVTPRGQKQHLEVKASPNQLRKQEVLVMDWDVVDDSDMTHGAA